MIRLLNANFARLCMNRLFRLGIVISAVLGVVLPTISRQLNVKLIQLTGGMIGQYVEGSSLDYFCFTWVLFLVIFAALFCSVFVSTEYSDGTIRNKIAAGYSRTQIYLSDLLINMLAASILYSVYLLVDLAVGIPTLGGFQYFTMEKVFVYVVCMYLIMFAFSAIFTWISKLVSNPALSIIICIGIVVLLLLIAIRQTGNLQWKEYWQDDWQYAGVLHEAGTKNTLYVGGIRRMISVFLVDFLPGGPLLQFYSFEYLLESDNLYLKPLVMAAGALFFFLVMTVTGVSLFRKKELR
jgi:ABC-type transport system involved in multi-copper enzyme maturation permease subunit